MFLFLFEQIYLNNSIFELINLAQSSRTPLATAKKSLVLQLNLRAATVLRSASNDQITAYCLDVPASRRCLERHNAVSGFKIK